MPSTDEILLARCAAIAVSSWSDALDELGIEGVMQGITRRSGSGRMCGFAMTAKQVPGGFGDYDKSEFAVGRLVAATGPGTVLVIDVDGRRSQPSADLHPLPRARGERQGSSSTAPAATSMKSARRAFGLPAAGSRRPPGNGVCSFSRSAER
jgi:hypothetical protein